MDVMKPIASSDIPTGADWCYEVKYDGFRCILHWDKSGNIRLTSKNKKDLTPQFPEIVSFCQEKTASLQDFLPVRLDGELVILNNPYQGNFSRIQKRGRLKNATTILKASKDRPATLMAFDILELSGEDLSRKNFQSRKESLIAFFDQGLNEKSERIAFVNAFKNPDELWKIIFDYKGEGMIAKRTKSVYGHGKKHQDWYKIKNWRIIQGVLTAYDSKNDYFDVHVFKGNELHPVGKCKHGLNEDDFATVKKLFMTNGEKNGIHYILPPAICAVIHTLDIYDGELREPEFERIAPEIKPEECTIDQLQLQLSMLPKQIEFANTDKFYWPDVRLTKGNYVAYMREISPYMLPFLEDRALTIIRCPDGVREESFFQKHLPSYAPEYIRGVGNGEEKLIVCDSLESLMWFANHGAIEFHVPFQGITSSKPREIVFDLDPPGRERFSWAIEAGLLIKQILDDLQLLSFVKTSGNKGLQIHIPIPEGSLSYEETGVFTQAIALTIESQLPDITTTERMKNKRHGKLYIDYVQHGKDKTIIAPYSARKTNDGTVSTPLFWDEVTEDLHPEKFTIANVVERVQTLGCPFRDYFKATDKQNLDRVSKLIQ